MDTQWDAVVVGGGAAGLSAALMLVRARRRVAVIDAGEPRNRVVEHMHGVLGHDGRSPLDLLRDGRRDVKRYGGVIVEDRALEAVRTQHGFEVRTASGGILTARRLVVATGLWDQLPDVPGLAQQWGRGVVVCPYCDGFEVRDKRIGVLATGARSMHQVQLLRQWSPDVTYLVHDGPVPSDDERRGLDARGIVVEERRLSRVVDTDGVLAGVELADGIVLPLDSIFTGPTLIPNDGMLRALGAEVALSPLGVDVVVTDPTGKTSVDGVWAIGNVANPMANVPMSMGAGSFAGAAINADLVEEDVARAVAATLVP